MIVFDYGDWKAIDTDEKTVHIMFDEFARLA